MIVSRQNAAARTFSRSVTTSHDPGSARTPTRQPRAPPQNGDAGIVFEDSIELVGWSIPERVSVGEEFEIKFVYKALRPLDRSWKIFVHLVGMKGGQYAEPPEVRIFGLFHTSNIASNTIAAKRTPVKGTPADLFAKDGQCYAVTNQPAKDGGGHDVTIERSDNGRDWHRSITFASDAMVRSAELMDGRFYLGTGCELGHCSAAAGRLLSVRAAHR